MTSAYFEMVKPTYIENWPRELCSLSIAQVDIPLNAADVHGLLANMMDYGSEYCCDESPDLTNLRLCVECAVRKFPAGCMIRLGSRSPKDSWLWFKGPKIVPGDGDPLRFVLDASERMYDDLRMAQENGYQPHLFVRQWVNIPPWTELRCFMRDRQLVGISQYSYHFVYPEIAVNESTMRWAVEVFFDQHFLSACPLRNVVFDVWPIIKRRGRETEVEVKLLEINPFFEMTDPCLFDWRNGGDFDGSFRFRKESTPDA